MWGKAKKEDKLAAARKRAAAKSMKGAKKPDPRIAKLKKEKGLGKKNEDDVKPTHFDITSSTRVSNAMLLVTES